MKQATAKVIPAGKSSRLWMFLAFMAGIVFTAVLAQTLVTVNAVVPASPGNHDSQTPAAVPGDGYLVNINMNTTFNS